MLKLPKTLRFFKKPDHISFLIGYPLILSATALGYFELKLASLVFFSFTLFYEIYEISKGNRQIFKLDHVAFLVAYALLILTFWENFQIILIISSILFGFTLGYEIYSVRKKDLEYKRKNSSK
jgi:hypothetical protein